MLSLQLLDMLKFYTGFEISDQTGNALTEKEMTTLHYDRITSLQVQTLHAGGADRHATAHFSSHVVLSGLILWSFTLDSFSI